MVATLAKLEKSRAALRELLAKAREKAGRLAQDWHVLDRQIVRLRKKKPEKRKELEFRRRALEAESAALALAHNELERKMGDVNRRLGKLYWKRRQRDLAEGPFIITPLRSRYTEQGPERSGPSGTMSFILRDKQEFHALLEGLVVKLFRSYLRRSQPVKRKGAPITYSPKMSVNEFNRLVAQMKPAEFEGLMLETLQEVRNSPKKFRVEHERLSRAYLGPFTPRLLVRWLYPGILMRQKIGPYLTFLRGKRGRAYDFSVSQRFGGIPAKGGKKLQDKFSVKGPGYRPKRPPRPHRPRA